LHPETTILTISLPAAQFQFYQLFGYPVHRQKCPRTTPRPRIGLADRQRQAQARARAGPKFREVLACAGPPDAVDETSASTTRFYPLISHTKCS
jgi:hypothetical protein